MNTRKRLYSIEKLKKDVKEFVKTRYAKKNRKPLPKLAQGFIIELYYGANQSITQINAMIGLNYDTVERIIKQYKTPFNAEREIIVKQSKINRK